MRPPPRVFGDPWFTDSRRQALRARQNRGRLRGRDHPNRQKDVCPQEHPYDAENTYRDPSGARRCKACQRDRARRQVR